MLLDANQAVNGYSLSRTFWSDFVERHWEKSPLAIRRPFAAPLATAEELFSALVDACDQYRRDERAAGPDSRGKARVRFNLGDARAGHAQLMTDVGKHLPLPADETVEGYARRLARQSGDIRFELIVRHFQALSMELWLRMSGFFRGLYEFVGIPAENSEAVLFLRNHEATSFGMHRDEAGVFMFILQGRKRVLTWPRDYFDGGAGAFCTLDYERFRGDALILDGGPGDIIYWPSGHWHVAESSGPLSASISLGLRLDYEPVAEVLRHLGRAAGARLGANAAADTYPFDPDDPQQSAADVPATIEAALEAVKEVCRGEEFERLIKLAWLNRVTSFGFVSVPPPLPRSTLGDGEVIRGRPGYPVVWIPLEDGQLACSANGHSLKVKGSAEVIQMIELLNTGAPRSVNDIIRGCAGHGAVREAAILRNLLESLFCIRAVEAVNNAAA
jgi:hypothetical protein